MKYLVNRETKEHKVYSGTEFYDDEAWRVVDTDDGGWIKWYGKSNKCPLPADAKVEVRFIYDNGASFDLLAGDWQWNDSQLTHYRPILPAESTPTIEETWHKTKQEAKVDVFARLAEAVAASDSIPALIAEINAMLPEGYEVTRK